MKVDLTLTEMAASFVRMQKAFELAALDALGPCLIDPTAPSEKSPQASDDATEIFDNRPA